MKKPLPHGLKGRGRSSWSAAGQPVRPVTFHFIIPRNKYHITVPQYQCGAGGAAVVYQHSVQ